MSLTLLNGRWAVELGSLVLELVDLSLLWVEDAPDGVHPHVLELQARINWLGRPPLHLLLITGSSLRRYIPNVTLINKSWWKS